MKTLLKGGFFYIYIVYIWKMIFKIITKFESRIIITLLLLTYFLPNFASIDRIGNQWLYLSIINLLGLLTIFYRHNSDFKLIYFKNIYILRWYLLFIIVGFLSIIASHNITESIFTLNQYFNCFVALYLMFYFISHIEKPEKFVTSLYFILLLFELYFSFTPILNDIINDTLVYRSMNYSGLAANINITSFSIVFKIPILIYLTSNAKSIYIKFILSIILLISLYTIFILGSRGALLGLIICFGTYLIYLFFNFQKIKKNILSFFLIVLSIILSISLNILSFKNKNASVINRASTISLSTNDGSVNQRLRYYNQGIDQFINKPFLGVGIGNWKLNSIKYDKYDIFGYTVPYHAHNDFIQILAEQGIFAFLFYLMVFISFVYILFKRRLIFFENKYFFFTASFLIYFLDSNLNFPIARPISQLQFILLIALISTKQDALK